MNKSLDWPRIQHLLKLGIIASLMVLTGDRLDQHRKPLDDERLADRVEEGE